MSSLDSCLDLLFGEAHLTEGEEKLPNSLQNEGKLEEEKKSNEHECCFWFQMKLALLLL